MVDDRNLVNNVHMMGTLICFDNLTPYELRVNSAEEQKVTMTMGVAHSIFNYYHCPRPLCASRIKVFCSCPYQEKYQIQEASIFLTRILGEALCKELKISPLKSSLKSPFKENLCAGLKVLEHIFLNEVRLMASTIASE